MNAIELLKKDHRKAEDLFEEIEKALENENSKKVDDLFEELKKELEVHMEIEETVFYPSIVNEKKTHDVTLEGYEEHHVAKLLIKELTNNNKDSDRWKAKLKVLKENIDHHIEEEEEEMFVKVKEIMDEGQLDEIGKKIADKKKELM